MRFLRQFLQLLLMNLAGFRQRLGPVLTILIGVTCAVGALVSMLAMGSGVRRQALGDARPDRVVFTSLEGQGSQGSIPREEAAAVRSLPGIRRGLQGQPIVVSQVILPLQARRRGTGKRTFYLLLGVSPGLTELVPELHLTDGRMFRPGLHELIASNACVRQFSDFGLGDKRDIHGNDWTVVGHFDSGQSQNCVVHTDDETLMAVFGRNTYSQVTALLHSPADFAALRAALQADPALHLEVRLEAEVIAAEFKEFTGLLNFISYFIGTIMALGAILGAVNSLYSIVDSRRRESATLRAIGFGPAPISAAVLCESILFALPGAVLGGILAWLFFDGMSTSPLGFTFQLSVTPRLAEIGIAWSLAIGLLGGLLPALRAARMPVSAALREV
ncbi:MAG: ABC transporter permease [Gammaproteobacteria bacterium]|nr:ABC transporter permease [Gammaproteobacteria bacterium]MBV9621394.1 ABC transporter permease [Gammaproteobacteria bacterium]